VFNRFLSRLGVADKSVEILRVVDKLRKIGREETGKLLAALAGDAAAGEILEYIRGDEGFEPTLERITRLAGGPNPDSERLSAIRDMAVACGLADSLVLAPSITRGLDYYTGVVFETFLDAMPEIGSVCSGGRYNDLASLYTKLRIPGVGASVGLDRLLAALEAIGRRASAPGAIRVLVADVEDALMPEYQAAAAVLRGLGIACEVFPEQRKLGQQFAHAERKGATHALVRGSAEKARNAWILRDLSARADAECASPEEAAGKLAR